jgi:hypothetical protein
MRGNGSVNTNLDSDFFYKRTIEMGIVEQLIDPAHPDAPREEIRDGVRGYVAGYNQWLAAKWRQPALRSIVPAAAPWPGLDYPARNNAWASLWIQSRRVSGRITSQ